MGWLIKTNGQIQEVKPKNGNEFSLEELQNFVGGYIEMIPAGRLVTSPGIRNFRRNLANCIGYINEEGKLNGLPINQIATLLYQYGDQDPIAGDMIVCEESETS